MHVPESGREEDGEGEEGGEMMVEVSCLASPHEALAISHRQIIPRIETQIMSPLRKVGVSGFVNDFLKGIQISALLT